MTHFSTNAKCVEKQKLWRMKFKETPQELPGLKYSAGRLIMGPGSNGAPNSFDIEASARDIDRKI